MALDNLDPSIPLQAGNIQIGNPQQLNAILAMQLRAQQLRQLQQSENAIRQLYGTPGNLDEQGRPTPNALANLMQVSPQAGMEVQNQLSLLDERKARLAGAQADNAERHRKIGYEIIQDVLATYDTALKDTNDQKIANQRAMERRAELVDEHIKDGSLPPRAAQGMPWDPIKYRSAIAGYQASQQKPMTTAERVRAGQEQERIDIAKNKATLHTDYGRTPPVEYKMTPDGKTTDMAGNPYTPTGVGEPKGAEAQLYKGKAGDKDVTVRMGPTGGWVNAETNEPVTGVTGISKVGTKAENSGRLAPSKEIAIVDAKGNVVDRFAARESSAGPGWVRSDSGEPVTVPPGGKIDVGQAAGAVIGSRENVYIGRILEGGITATTDLENISKMPVGVTSGVFGGRKQGPGLLDATKEVLANKLTTQDVQIYNSANTGIQRALAVIESSGLAPSGAFTEQFQGLTLKEGDSQLARLYKMANARQIVENGMAVIAANPRVAPEQKELAKTFLDRVKTAIPWTTSDVIRLQTSDDPDATLHNLGIGKTGTQSSTQPSATRSGTRTPSGIGIYSPGDQPP